jgi:hypothetical protein
MFVPAFVFADGVRFAAAPQRSNEVVSADGVRDFVFATGVRFAGAPWRLKDVAAPQHSNEFCWSPAALKMNRSLPLAVIPPARSELAKGTVPQCEACLPAGRDPLFFLPSSRGAV